MINISDFETIKKNGENLYHTIGDVYCPYFKEKIAFNSKALEHIRFKRRDKARPEKDQYMRFKLLHLVPEILGLSRTLQGVWETKKFERIRVNSRTDTILVPVCYYEFIAVVHRNRIRIVIKQINGGEKYFWSIIPFWQMDKETMSRILHDGMPEED